MSNFCFFSVAYLLCIALAATLLTTTAAYRLHASHSFTQRSKKLLTSRLRLQAVSSSANEQQRRLIVGVNKYSHDASCCILDASNGDILFCQAKERITGRKNDGGAVGSLLRYALNSIGAKASDIDAVVSNNHHFRVHPFERRLPFATAVNYCPKEYNDEYNLLPNVKHRYELSHHLAHAWSVIASVPFDQGVILVMDGMGESYKAMIEDVLGVEEHSGDYMHDLKLLKAYGSDAFIGQPTSLSPGSSYREAETAYVFNRQQALLRPVFKRWGRERSPAELYNHGFENMESLGAVYSRVSSHVLGDWNACGKIMGLAPWAGRKRSDADCGGSWYFNAATGDDLQQLGLGDEFYHKHNFMQGNPIITDSFQIDWKALEGLSHTNQWSDERFGYNANIAQSVQSNLQQCALDLCVTLRHATGEPNLALAGGVALNSVLNAQLKREAGFEQLYVPAAPGDEGIALGCAMYGLQRQRELAAFKAAQLKAQAAVFNFPRSGVQALIDSVDPEQFDIDSSPTTTATTADTDAITTATSAATTTAAGGDDKGSKSVGTIINVSETSSDSKVIDFGDVVPFHKLISPAATAVASLFSAYQGRQHTEEDLDEALYEMDPWIHVQNFPTAEALIADAVATLTATDSSSSSSSSGSSSSSSSSSGGGGKVIAWFQGRSEFGQRALGARSIIADPRRAEMRRFVNEKVKLREWYRPLAPSVLDEHVSDWFEDLQSGENASPYMSLTATIRSEKLQQVPAVSHIDRTARLQTVQEVDNPLFHQLIAAFYRHTGVPMVMNTSFNKKGQPIVESPLQAMQTLFSCDGSIDALYLGANKITIKPTPFDITAAAAPTEREADVIVRASPLYLSEITSRSSSNGAVRIRIQDGAINSNVIDLDANVGLHVTSSSAADVAVAFDTEADDATTATTTTTTTTRTAAVGEEEEEQQQEWRELPSELHHDILLLLQPDVPSEQQLLAAGISLSDFEQQATDLTVGEIFEALQSIDDNSNNSDSNNSSSDIISDSSDSSDSSSGCSWEELRSALRWLYMQQLLYFDDPRAEDAAAAALFGDASEVLDLRAFS